MKNFPAYIFLLIIFLAAITQTEAKVFASGLKISDDTVSTYAGAMNTWDGNFANGGVKIWFLLNEAGVGSVSGTVTILDNGSNVVRVLTMNNLVKGVNNIIWDGYNGLGVAVPIGNYTFRVDVQDPVGHTTFDSLWVALAAYNGPDPDGNSTWGYRGNASITDQSASTFGNIYVVRGTSLTTSINGFYEISADGIYRRKIGTAPAWVASTPTEAATFGSNIYGVAGYGFTGAGYVQGGSTIGNPDFQGSIWGTNNLRGLTIRKEGNDTVFYSSRSAQTGDPSILKKVGILGDTATFINLRSVIPTGNGYVKGMSYDDAGNFYVIFGSASAQRKQIAKFSSTGDLLYNRSLDTAFALPTGSIFQSIVIDHGATNAPADDKIYLLVWAGVNSSPLNGIYRMNLDGDTLTQLVNCVGLTNSATAQHINLDPAGNVIWSNGGSQERVVVFSPASGPNSFSTASPAGLTINVLNPVPVELTSFTANVIGANVVLEWTTATETNNSGFGIERSSNGAAGNFTEIAFVAGNGNTTEVSRYSYADKNPAVGTYHYRLRQVDFDGTVSYSSVVSSEVSGVEGYILAQNYPNPFNPSTTIRFSIPKESQVSLQVFSMNGELVRTLVNGVKTGGEHLVEFNAEGLASGVYLYRLTAGQIVLTKKLNLLK